LSTSLPALVPTALPNTLMRLAPHRDLNIYRLGLTWSNVDVDNIDIQRMNKTAGSCHNAMAHAIDPTACGVGFGCLVPMCSMTCCATFDKDIYLMTVPAKCNTLGHDQHAVPAIAITCLSIDPLRLKERIAQEVARHPYQSGASSFEPKVSVKATTL